MHLLLVSSLTASSCGETDRRTPLRAYLKSSLCYSKASLLFCQPWSHGGRLPCSSKLWINHRCFLIRSIFISTRISCFYKLLSLVICAQAREWSTSPLLPAPPLSITGHLKFVPKHGEQLISFLSLCFQGSYICGELGPAVPVTGGPGGFEGMDTAS